MNFPDDFLDWHETESAEQMKTWLYDAENGLQLSIRQHQPACYSATIKERRTGVVLKQRGDLTWERARAWVKHELKRRQNWTTLKVALETAKIIELNAILKFWYFFVALSFIIGGWMTYSVGKLFWSAICFTFGWNNDLLPPLVVILGVAAGGYIIGLVIINAVKLSIWF